MIKFTADTHFNHLLMSNMRGYATIEEHDEVIISNWNKQVSKKDLVYHLGDFCFGGHDVVRKIRMRLNGKIILILGNHDHANRIHNIKGIFSEMHDIREIKIKGNKVVLCHYAMRVWPSSHYNSWQLHGHSHGKLESQGKQWDVGLERNLLSMLDEDSIIEIMNNQPDNFNFKKHPYPEVTKECICYKTHTTNPVRCGCYCHIFGANND